MSKDEIEELRALVLSERLGKRGPFSGALRERLHEFLKAQSRAGASLNKLGAELGLSHATVHYYDRTTLIPSIATTVPNGVQVLESEGGGQVLSSGFDESVWGRHSFAFSSDGSCLALRENIGWRVWSEMPFMATAPLEVDQVILR